jgi:hypothetical protein
MPGGETDAGLVDVEAVEVGVLEPASILLVHDTTTRTKTTARAQVASLLTIDAPSSPRRGEDTDRSVGW